MPKRVIQVDKNLYFEYEVVPHRRIQERIVSASSAGMSVEDLSKTAEENANKAPIERNTVSGAYIPFKQVRLKGQINPLKPPKHLETVLIGRALGQRTGYLFGVGFRFRDDGDVEGEFLHGKEKFNSFVEFEQAVTTRLRHHSSRNG